MWSHWLLRIPNLAEHHKDSMTRKTVVRFAFPFDPHPVNVNDEIGLDPHLDYTLTQHLEDLEHSGPALRHNNGILELLRVDGSSVFLGEFTEKINVALLDEETATLVASAKEELQATA